MSSSQLPTNEPYYFFRGVGSTTNQDHMSCPRLLGANNSNFTHDGNYGRYPAGKRLRSELENHHY